MSAYRLAHLTAAQMAALERLENEIHVTLVAYEPANDTATGATTQLVDEDFDEGLDEGAVEALVDTYRSGSPTV